MLKFIKDIFTKFLEPSPETIAHSKDIEAFKKSPAFEERAHEYLNQFIHSSSGVKISDFEMSGGWKLSIKNRNVRIKKFVPSGKIEEVSFICGEMRKAFDIANEALIRLNAPDI